MSVLQTIEPEARAVEAIRDALPAGASIKVKHARRDVVDLEINGHQIEIKWIGDGRLGDVRQLVRSAKRHKRLIAVARRMTPGARALLAEHGIGWVDETGAAEIANGAILVSRTGRVTRQKVPSLRWTSSVLATAEALMCDTPATVSAVEAATGLSAGSSTNALRTLTDLGLLESDSNRGPTSGRRIANLDALLEAYTTAAQEQPQRTELVVGALWRDPIDGVKKIGTEWTAHSVGWVVSGTIASAVLAPLLTNVESALVYIDTSTMAGLRYAAETVGLAPIEGGRLTLRPYPTVTTHRLRSTLDGIHVAPWPRVYADLQHSGVRGEEAAEHLRDVVTSGR